MQEFHDFMHATAHGAPFLTLITQGEQGHIHKHNVHGNGMQGLLLFGVPHGGSAPAENPKAAVNFV